MEQNRLEAARDELRWAIELDPVVAGAHLNLGAVLYKLGHVDEALRELQQAVTEERQSAHAEFSSGWHCLPVALSKPLKLPSWRR
jgi:Tfp pilus assembly protein PilF